MAGSPESPIPLVGVGLQRWRELIERRPWEDRELALLAAHCAAYGRWVDAETWLADPAHGAVITIRDDKGNIKSHGAAPQIAIADRAFKESARLAVLLQI